MLRIIKLLLISSSAFAWTAKHSSNSKTISLSSSFATPQSRQEFVQNAITGWLVTSGVSSLLLGTVGPSAAAAAVLDDVVTLPNGVSYKVTKVGTGLKPDVGDLVAIRFAASYGDIKIDDIFDTPEPYYTRIGSGALLKGVEETLPLMKLGDRWVLTVPGKLAFGSKGRPASAGKPRIPSDATIVFDVEMVGLPGKEIELIELIGDD